MSDNCTFLTRNIYAMASKSTQTTSSFAKILVHLWKEESKACRSTHILCVTIEMTVSPKVAGRVLGPIDWPRSTQSAPLEGMARWASLSVVPKEAAF